MRLLRYIFWRIAFLAVFIGALHAAAANETSSWTVAQFQLPNVQITIPPAPQIPPPQLPPIDIPRPEPPRVLENLGTQIKEGVRNTGENLKAVEQGGGTLIQAPAKAIDDLGQARDHVSESAKSFDPADTAKRTAKVLISHMYDGAKQGVENTEKATTALAQELASALSQNNAKEFNCSTDCGGVCTKCVEGLPCAPNLTCYAACGAFKIASCAEHAVKPNTPLHGNYCGLGSKEGKTDRNAEDTLDKACFKHDRCFEARGTNDCQCNRELVADASESIRAGDMTAASKERAALVAVLFSRFMTPPFCSPRL